MLTARLRPNPVASFSADHLDLLGTGFDETNNGGPPEIAFRVDLPIERGGKRERRIDLASASQVAGRGAVRRCGADAPRRMSRWHASTCWPRAPRGRSWPTTCARSKIWRASTARAWPPDRSRPSKSTRSEVAMLQFRSTAVRAELELATALARVRTLLGRSPRIRSTSPTICMSPSAADRRSRRGRRRSSSRSPRGRTCARFSSRQARSVADLRLQEALGRDRLHRRRRVSPSAGHRRALQFARLLRQRAAAASESQPG